MNQWKKLIQYLDCPHRRRHHHRGAHPELRQDENPVFIMCMIKNEFSGLPVNTRKYDILKSLIDANPVFCEKLEEQETCEADLKKAIETCKGTDTCQALIKFGFKEKDGSKHFKFVYHGDERYPITVSKTPSDYREGKNLFSEIKKNCLLIPNKL